METFHERITAEILLMGRYGVLVDAPSEPKSRTEDTLPSGWLSTRAESSTRRDVDKELDRRDALRTR